MIVFLTAIIVISALAIILLVLFHPEGRILGENLGPILADPKKKNGPSGAFNAYDKVIAAFVIVFFSATIGVNYLTVYKKNGEVSVTKILERKKIKEEQKKIDANPVGADAPPPIAE